MKNLNFFFINLFLILAFFSCKDDKTYRVHEGFSVYVDRFEKEAAARGRNFDFKNSGLIIEFADLEGNLAGLCHYEKPIRIEVDRKYWDMMKRYSGADLVCEELIFHEMGHGILNRDHLNTLLENDEWKSMMCGGDSIEGKTWNLNYRGIRRKYYLDELFNQNTPKPAYLSPTIPIDTTGYKTVVNDNFNDPFSSIWQIGKTSHGTLSIENGELVFRSVSDINSIVPIDLTGINVQSNFSFETSFRFNGGNTNGRFGLVFGAINPISKSAEMDYFLINNSNEMAVGNNTWFSYFTKIRQPKIIPFQKNKLKILKKDQMLYFFINDFYVYCSEIETSQDGFSFGFMAPPFETLYLDDFRIALKENASQVQSMRKMIGTQKHEVEIIPYELPETFYQK